MMRRWIDEILHGSRRQRTSDNRIRATTQQIVSASLNHSITTSRDVNGVAARGSKLYVGYAVPPTIDTYDTAAFGLQSRSNVLNTGCIYDMASCPDCDIVFVADLCNKMIRVLDAAGSISAQWKLGGEWPIGLSVNSAKNVIVTLRQRQKLREYTPAGRLVREVTLPSTIVNPLHAVQLGDSDRYVVSHADMTTHRVCVVSSGAVEQCYGGDRGAGDGQLDFPDHLAVFGDNSLVVADRENYRVLVLDVPSMTYRREIINTRNSRCPPWRMALNEQRLYVLFNSMTCAVRVFDLVVE